MNKEIFKKELENLEIILTKDQEEKLELYYELLVKANENINLTTIIKKEDVYLKHFYDSLTLTKVYDFNKDITLCDIGSGAGFPGIVLKIVFPNLKIVLVDSIEKKVKFLNDVITNLKLKDIKAIHSRGEEYFINNKESFDVIVSRAVAKTNILLEICSKGIKLNGLVILMKGEAKEEIKNASNAAKILGYNLENEQNFILPIEKSTRTLLVYKKEKISNNKYPRQFAKIIKTPL